MLDTLEIPTLPADRRGHRHELDLVGGQWTIDGECIPITQCRTCHHVFCGTDRLSP